MSNSIVGPWAKEKLDRLSKYLNAYTTILAKQRFEGFHYIDAFAGPGFHQVRMGQTAQSDGIESSILEAADFCGSQAEHSAFVSGSPRVALDLQRPFTTYTFIERSAERVEALKSLKAEFGDSRRIHIQETDCRQFLAERVASGRMDWKKNRAVVFLDPFGMQVEWRIIEALASTRAIEIFLNFPVGMAIQRLLLRKPNEFTVAERQKLDDYFGSPGWYSAVYQAESTLFGDEERKVSQSGLALLKWYRGRLEHIFSHVSNAALIRISHGGHLYYLLLASHNATGKRIANDILSAGEIVKA